MEIVLIVAIVVVAAAALSVAATFNRRTKETTAPLIDDAFSGLSEQLKATADDLRRQLGTITDELHTDSERQKLDERKVQGRLDHADSRIGSMANQILAELDAVKRLVEQVSSRQDKLSGDLGRLNQQVAGLGDSLARPSAAEPPADEAPPGETSGGPAIIPGQLYAERLRFTLLRIQPESFSRSGPQFRVQVERQVGQFPAPQVGAVNDPSVIIRRSEHDEGFRVRLGEAASGYFATKWGDPAFAAVTERWITQNTFPETALAAVFNRIASDLATVIERPLEKIGTELRLPGPIATTGVGIGGDLILQPVTRPLAQAAAFLEITCVVVGVATGLHPVALAGAKMLVHDEFHDLLARGLEQAARRVFTGPDSPTEDLGPVRPVPETRTISAVETNRPPTTPAPSTLPRPVSPPSAREPEPGDPDWPPTIGGPGFG